MKNIILSTLVTLSVIQSVNASQLLEYGCVIDYTQEIMHEQAKYIQRKNYTTPFDFNELGIEVASNQDPYYQEGFFYINESLIRDYNVAINGTRLTLKSNNKTLINTDLTNLERKVKVSSSIQSYTPSYLFVDFYFYNPDTMKNEINLQIYFDDRKIDNELVARHWGFKGTYDYYLDCQDEIGKTTFKEYQQHWISLYEAISKKEAEYTE
ncbi:hypothetical protein MHO82_12615 [Vibrio sp. Of7-15]|uniref:hypothetical protein n=1 Tax=Vibrio sp. Of7-15 TaxID=2724879 RepID=UPI001EF1D84E|nr:hypothetical protein [Vibrio sp. Of7-15]MCG7497706.1 hypothetical protein [Vibrio sp. Of7-15]